MNISETSVILGDDKYLSPIFEARNKLKADLQYINFDSKTNTDCFYGFDAFKSSGLYNLENDNKFKNIKINPDEMHFLLLLLELLEIQKVYAYLIKIFVQIFFLLVVLLK